MTIAREEIFGPVLSVMAYDDIDEVVARANDTDFGLVAVLWTKDLVTAHTLAAAAAVRHGLRQPAAADRPGRPVGRLRHERMGSRAG